MGVRGRFIADPVLKLECRRVDELEFLGTFAGFGGFYGHFKVLASEFPGNHGHGFSRFHSRGIGSHGGREERFGFFEEPFGHHGVAKGNVQCGETLPGRLNHGVVAWRGGLDDFQVGLFSGGKTAAEVHKAKKKLTRAEEKAKEVCDGISLQVKAAFLAIQEAKDRIGVAKEAVAQAEENLRLINNKYRENVVTSTDVVDAETLLTRNKQNYYTALYDYIVAIARLENAVGKKIIGPEKAAGLISPGLQVEKRNRRRANNETR